jgi:hypothetical protein
MTIKIALSSISEAEIEEILFHYNAMKPTHFGVLERLICYEGGFRIIPPENAVPAPQHTLPIMNQLEIEKRRAREIRWNQQKYLVPYSNIPNFLYEEEILLFKTMQFVLGKENVEYYSSYGEAKMTSPSLAENYLLKRSPKRNIQVSPPVNQVAWKRILPI